jgi:hypothetical protein
MTVFACFFLYPTLRCTLEDYYLQLRVIALLWEILHGASFVNLLVWDLRNHSLLFGLCWLFDDGAWRRYVQQYLQFDRVLVLSKKAMTTSR